MALQTIAYKVNNNSTYVKVSGSTGTVVPHVPIHLIVVIDVSGSMAENDRLANVKRSLQYIIPLMTSEDTFSLVSFNVTANTLCNNINLTSDGKRQAEIYVERLHAEGGTNIGSALITTSDLITATPDTHTPCILILTDGETNVGITDPNDLVNLIRNVRSSMAIYSIGYGTTHNFDLMRRLAAEGSGSYSVVENLEHVATVFGDVLGGIQSIVAQNCEIMLPLGAEAVTQLKTTDGPRGKIVHLGNMYAGSEQTLIINNLPVSEGSGIRMVTYRYFDVATRSLVTQEIPVAPEGDLAEAEAYILRLDAASMMDSISRGTAAEADLNTMIVRLSGHEAISWVPAIKAELERVLTMIRNNPGGGITRDISGVAANNYSVLSQGRGVSMGSQALDGIPITFSTPTQRRVAASAVRAVSGPAHAATVVPTIPLNVGGSAGAPAQPLTRSYAGIDLSIAGLPLSIPPLPTSFEEMEDDSRPVTPTAQIRRGRPSSPPPLIRRG